MSESAGLEDNQSPALFACAVLLIAVWPRGSSVASSA
jgi:hypothetical protein